MQLSLTLRRFESLTFSLTRFPSPSIKSAACTTSPCWNGWRSGVLCHNDSVWNDMSWAPGTQEEPRLEKDGLFHLRSKKSGGSSWQKAGWGQPGHTSHKEWSPNPWVCQNVWTWKQVSRWDGLKRWNWGQSLSQKSGKDHGIDSGSQPEISLKITESLLLHRLANTCVLSQRGIR